MKLQLKIALICLALISCTFCESSSSFLKKYLEQNQYPESARRQLADPDDNCVILYKHADYKGSSFERCSTKKDLGGNQRNEISSVKLGDNIDYIQMFDNDDFLGESITLYRDYSSISNVGGKNFNDKVNSYIISPKLDDDCVRFWQYEHLIGDKWTVCKTDPGVDSSKRGKFNYVQLGKNVSNIFLRQFVYFAGNQLQNIQESKVVNDNRFQSLNIVHDSLPGDCVWLFKDTNYSGSVIELCGSVGYLGNYGGVSSLQLGSNVDKIRVYQDTAYRGDYVEYDSDQSQVGDMDNLFEGVQIFYN